MSDWQFSPLAPADFDEIAAAFALLGWNKPRSKYERYYEEQATGSRTVLVCKVRDEFAAYVTILWKSAYPLFHTHNAPEISDLNVLPKFRKKGIGAQLIGECEALAKQKGFSNIGLGVGLIADYGSAQRLYFRLGYMPDGQGLHYGIEAVHYNQSVTADDDLVLYYLKKL